MPYHSARGRLEFPNSGDIILLANLADGFHFNVTLSGNHGSLAFADSVVPLALAYPDGDIAPEMLLSIKGYMGTLVPANENDDRGSPQMFVDPETGSATSETIVRDPAGPAEAIAIRRFFLSR